MLFFLDTMLMLLPEYLYCFSLPHLLPRMNIIKKNFAFTSEASIVQVHEIGPWGITYVKPEDDPRNQAMK